MSGLNYEGAYPSDPADIADQDYVNSLTVSNLTQDQVDALIVAGYSPYALKTYADTQDTHNANQTYIDAGDAALLQLADINVNAGVPALDSSGKVQVSRVNIATTQRYLKGFWSPSAYNASPVVSASVESTIYTCAVSDPGYIYRLFITGQVDTKSTVDGEYPIINVRVGSTSGQIIARGMGNAESYTVGSDINYGTCSIVPLPLGNQNSLTGSTTLYITLHRSGAASTVTATVLEPSLCIMAVPDIADNATLQVLYDSTGDGNKASGTSLTWPHIIGAGANTVVAMVSLHDSSPPLPGLVTASIGGVPMNQLGSVAQTYGSGGKASVGEDDDLFIFALFDPPTGSQTITVNFPTSNAVGNSVSYSKVTRFGVGSAMMGSGTALSQSVASNDGQVVVQAFLCADMIGSFSAYDQTTRYTSPGVSGVCEPFILGEAPGAPSVTFDATAPGSGYWIGVALPLLSGGIPAPPVFDAVGDGYQGGLLQNFSWNHTATTGAFVIVDICTYQNVTVTSCTYGGSAMILLGIVPNDNNVSYGYLTRYVIAHVPGGNQTVAVGLSAAGYTATASSVSYTGVNYIGPAQTVYGSTSPATQKVICSGGQIVVSALGAYGAASPLAPSGGITRFNGNTLSGGTYFAPLVMSDAPGTPIGTGNDTTKSVTFSASSTTVSHWGGIATVISS